MPDLSSYFAFKTISGSRLYALSTWNRKQPYGASSNSISMERSISGRSAGYGQPPWEASVNDLTLAIRTSDILAFPETRSPALAYRYTLKFHVHVVSDGQIPGNITC